MLDGWEFASKTILRKLAGWLWFISCFALTPAGTVYIYPGSFGWAQVSVRLGCREGEGSIEVKVVVFHGQPCTAVQDIS